MVEVLSSAEEFIKKAEPRGRMSDLIIGLLFLAGYGIRSPRWLLTIKKVNENEM